MHTVETIEERKARFKGEKQEKQGYKQAGYTGLWHLNNYCAFKCTKHASTCPDCYIMAARKALGTVIQ